MCAGPWHDHQGRFAVWGTGMPDPMTGAPSSILLIADPGVPVVIAERLSDSLPNALTDCAAAGGKWDVSVRRDSYPVDEHAEVLEVIRNVDPAGETEDIVIYLTVSARLCAVVGPPLAWSSSPPSETRSSRGRSSPWRSCPPAPSSVQGRLPGTPL
jgi:hypothetical protein